ncbi:helix-turn-helix transcriptional regulator [Microbacterium sp. NPDC057650]|uniref:helix-turn-helix transcriptional regulator n=1 Tax=unclassified Microbacterium TaxID=2609290 RepID=UPI0036703856
MTRTTGRTLALLSLLQVRRDWTGAELRERLEVSDRTLRRDIDDLRELGYGIEATRGRHGGYRLGPGASVPPLTLLDDESVAIAVGLRAAAASVVTGMEEAAGRALAKLEQSLSAAARTRIAEVERAMVRLDPAEGGGVDLEVVTALAAAISARRRLRIDYTRHDGAEVRRIVEPYRIVHTDARWYLVARDAEREEWRTLRVDRIRRPFALPEEFTEREVPDDAVRRFTARSITIAPYPFRARVRMQAPAAEVRQRFDVTTATVTADGEESCILEAGSRDPEEFALYLGMSGFGFEILEGEEVRQAVAAVGERLRNAVL